MPQLDLNTFTGVAWWITIIFYVSYLWFLIYPFARLVANEKAVQKYRLFKTIQLLDTLEDSQHVEKNQTCSDK